LDRTVILLIEGTIIGFFIAFPLGIVVGGFLRKIGYEHGKNLINK
jgi:hypothetical protein